MKVNSLKIRVSALTLALALLLFFPSCGESDKSGNNSTTVSETDTISNSPVANTTDTATTRKKQGKITITSTAPAADATLKPDARGYYNTTETAPTFGGGSQALEMYFNNNIDFPQEAIDNNVEGTVLVSFTIDEDGTIGNAKATGGKLGYGLDEEAVRVVKSMQTWTAGTIKGKKVKAWYTLPVTFRTE